MFGEKLKNDDYSEVKYVFVKILTRVYPTENVIELNNEISYGKKCKNNSDFLKKYDVTKINNFIYNIIISRIKFLLY